MSDTTSGPSCGRFYRPELDGLRFFAFLAVFLNHALPQGADVWIAAGLSPAVAVAAELLVTGGGMGVDLFFALSSFLITELLVRELAVTGRLDVWRFYAKRALRIWPLYFAFLAVTWFVVRPWTSHETMSASALPWFIGFAGNWFLYDRGMYFESVAVLLWSVAIEEQYYLVWPLVLRLFGARRLAWACAGLIVVAMAARGWAAWIGLPHPRVWVNTFMRLDPIALGALLSLSLHGAAPTLTASRRALAMVLGCSMLFVTPAFAGFAGWSAVYGYFFAALGATAVVWATLNDRPGWLASPALVYLGRISYGLYVVHFLALWIAADFIGGATGMTGIAAKAALGLAITVPLAALSYHLIERPFLTLKARLAVIPSRPDGVRNGVRIAQGEERELLRRAS